MKQLREGLKAPVFTLKDKDDNTVSLSEIEADYTVVYFYPKDNTPGCTIEAQEFSKSLPEFKKLNAEVIGISGGDNKSKEKFCTKYKLRLPLVTDSDFKIAEKYNSFGEKKFMGKTYNGIHRKTFILDSERRILKIYDKVKPLGHSKEVLDFINSCKNS